MGVVSRRWVWLLVVGGIYGCGGYGWNLWVWLVGVVVRRCIDFLILLIPTPRVSVRFCISIPAFCSLKNFFVHSCSSNMAYYKEHLFGLASECRY